MTHTAEIVTLARKITTTFNNIYGENFINLPLLLSSILLHDIGKLYELDVDTLTGNVEYSTDALLESHIMRGLTLIDNQAYKIKMGIQTYSINELNEEEENKTTEELVEEQEALKLLRHCIASHHGKLEWGSPVTPSVPEAFILHTADILSAEMYKYSKQFKGIEPGSGVSRWTAGGLVKTYKDTTK